MLDRGNELVIKREALSKDQSTFFDLRGLDPDFFQYFPNDTYLRYIDSLYRQGADRIEIYFDNPNVVKYIEEKVEELPSFEIIKQEKDSCLIKSISMETEREFEALLNRFFYLIINNGNELFEILKKGKQGKLMDLQTFEKASNKFSNLCERILNKIGYKDSKRVPLLYTMVCLLEQIGDDLASIVFSLQGLKKRKMSFSKESLNFFKEVVQLIDGLHKLFNKFDRVRLFELLKNRHYRINSAAMETLLKQKNSEDIILLHYASSMMTKAYHLAEAFD